MRTAVRIGCIVRLGNLWLGVAPRGRRTQLSNFVSLWSSLLRWCPRGAYEDGVAKQPVGAARAKERAASRSALSGAAGRSGVSSCGLVGPGGAED
jgi:hypothetical protein